MNQNVRKILILGACGSIGIKILEKFLAQEPNSVYFICTRDRIIDSKIKKKIKINKIKFISI